MTESIFISILENRGREKKRRKKERKIWAFFSVTVQVFSEASIMFSVGGKYYTGDPIVYSYMEDRIFEHSRNISIKLHHRIGKFVKLRFGFASRWIMISEITFDSGNYQYSNNH